MALPFGVWDSSEAFNRAQDFEEEQDEQTYEVELSKHDEFVLRLTPALRDSVKSRNDKQTYLEVSQLIITSDSIATAFLDTYLINQDLAVKIGVITGPYIPSATGNTVHQTSLWDKSCFLYSLDDTKDTVVCQMKQELDDQFLFDWVDKLFSVIRPRSVVLLTAKPKSSFQLEEVKDSGLDALYQLRCDAYEGRTNIPTLPRPNLVKDLPAAVLTHCQVQSIPAILYILATETLHFDVTAVKSFAPILDEDCFKGVQKNSDANVKEALKELCKLDIPDCGVYI